MDVVTPAQAEAYDRWYETPLGRWVDQCEKQAVWSLLPPVAGRRWLDGGCGTGNFTRELAARGAAVVGVDRNAAMLARVRLKADLASEGVSLVQGSLTSLPFAAQSFDGATVILALDFVAARRQVLAELGRVLRPRGILVVAALNRHSLFTLKRRLRGWLRPSWWGGVDFLGAAALARLVDDTGEFERLAWRRAVYCPPLNISWLVKLGPWWESLGASLLPGAAAFLALAARKKAAPSQGRTNSAL